jgi:glycosyltransferase involved in cell wall biosynthesis
MFPAGHTAKAVLIERITLKRALKKAAAVLVVSENTKKDLLKRFHFNEHKIHLTHCAPGGFFREEISADELESFRNKMKLPQNFILAVGTLEPRKNFDTLIKSFVIIKRKYPDYKLVIAGKKGWKYHLIEKALKHYKMEQDVIFTGYMEDNDLRALYALAKVFVFPSLYEGFGIPPLEAMASGCPVVSSNVASLPEVVGQGGLLIDPSNALKIADAVCSLLEDEQARQMMIERGRIQSEKFCWEASAKIALEVINGFA